MSISRLQNFTLRDPGIKGPLWISKVTLPPPAEPDLGEHVRRAVAALGTDAGGTAATPGTNGTATGVAEAVPAAAAVEAEWTGFRSDASSRTKRPGVSEAEQYTRLMKDVRSDIVVLYLHGGGLYLLDPATYRESCASLAKKLGGRCLNVRYRLAPQHAFPAALLDVLSSYLYLLYPPVGALHEPVPANKVVVSGDSAGGNLSLSLLQLLLQINRSAKAGDTLRYHGHEIPLPLPLPAGLALLSPWTDLTASMPSNSTNAKYDYLPALSEKPRLVHVVPDHIWPATPPRLDLYCQAPQLMHPLVSPLAAQDWSGSCPVFVVCGEECLTDEGRGVAGVMAAQGVVVEWIEVQTMPHVFVLVLPGSPASKLCFDKWTGFIERVTAAETQKEDGQRQATRATLVELPRLKEREMTTDDLCRYSTQQIRRLMLDGYQRRLRVDQPASPSAEPAVASKL